MTYIDDDRDVITADRPPVSGEPRTMYERGFEHGAHPERHEHIDGCGHNGEGVEQEFLRGWRDGRTAPHSTGADAPPPLDARNLLLEFGQWLADNLSARRGMEEAFDSDEPDEYAATVDAFLDVRAEQQEGEDRPAADCPCDPDVWGPDGLERGDGHNPASKHHGGRVQSPEGAS